MYLFRKLRSWIVVVAVCVVVNFTATEGYSYYVNTPGVAAAVVGPPPPAVFNVQMAIMPAPPALGGFGDIILNVEVGRDDTGHFCTIAAALAPLNPIAAVLAGIPAPINFAIPAGIVPVGFTPVQLIFRPTNDPAHVGWGGFPAGMNVITNDMQAVANFAAQLGAFRALSGAPITMPPWCDFELDINPANPSFMEFYKFRICR